MRRNSMRFKTIQLWALVLCFVLAGTGIAMAQEDMAHDAVEETESMLESAGEVVGSTAEATGDMIKSGAEDVVETGGAAVGAVGEAVSETAGTVVGGAKQVGEQGKAVWTDALMPMYERMLAAIPILLKALLVLFLFWVVANIVGAAVSKLLSLTDIDNKAAREWGLGDMLEPKDGKAVSLEGLAGGIAKWIILLVGFVAFFNALNLEMVAGPLQNIVNQMSGAAMMILKAAVILVVAWGIGTVLKLAVTKALQAVGFDDRVERFMPAREVKGEMVGPSSLIGRLLFYIVLLLALPLFLEALGQDSLVAPLSDMFSKAFAFVPNILMAVVLFFVAKIVATIVREIVTNFLAAVGVDRFAERFGIGEAAGTKKLSDIAGAVAYFFIFLPLLVQAVAALKMQAISEPLQETIGMMTNAIPQIFLAVIVLAIFYFVAKTVRGLLESFLQGVSFDQLPEKLGLDFLRPRGAMSLSAIASVVVFTIMMLLGVRQALAILNFGPLSDMVGSLIAYLPNLVIGLAIILAALSLGTYVASLIRNAMGTSPNTNLVTTIARVAIIFLGFSMGLNQLGVGDEIVRIAASAVLFGTALALGLAFGLGGRDRAQELIDKKSRGL